MASLVVPRAILDRAIAHCRKSHPHEACGLLAGKEGRASRIFEMTNANPSPVSYLMEPAEQFRAMKEMRSEGLELLAIFHSHPQSPPVPSGTDVSLAFYDDAVYIIVGLIDPEKPDIRAYRIVEGMVSEEVIGIVE